MKLVPVLGSLAVTAALFATVTPAEAAASRVEFKAVKKTCSRYTTDGSPSIQCRATWTTKVLRTKKGQTVILRSSDDPTRDLVKKKAAGATTWLPVKEEQVFYYGTRGHGTRHVTYRVLVKNAAGTVVFRSTLRKVTGNVPQP